MNLGLADLLIMAIILAAFILPLIGIVDAARQPDEFWRAAGRSRAAWIMLQLFLGVLGSVFYFIVRKEVRKAAQDLNEPTSP